ncbi:MULTISPECIES: DUF2089 domain-containing protein [unclassified Luteococcus]|uniref:DUF2089 domain-containing protein n=1 Tax=unclassified Luteococcus TaxID=2639923 RepID=UPI00313D16EF
MNSPADGPYRAPADCPVSDGDLVTTRLGCPRCGSELGGHFERCGFCRLSVEQLELLTVFLSSRGNLREVAKQQQVSYPTARARLSALLQQLGIPELGSEPGDDVAEPQAVPESPSSRAELLARVAAGQLDPAEAARLIARG